MIFDDVQRVADQQVTPVLPRSTSSICLLQMETQDALGDVLDKICHVDKPVLLLLPTSGDAFSRHEHFLPLRRLITKNVHPPFFCLVIPDQRVDEASLATLYGIPHAPSIEKALQLLAHFSLAIAEDPSFSAEAAALALQTLKQDDGTKEFGNVKTTPFPGTSGCVQVSKKRLYLLGTGMMALLFVVSAILVPFMFFIPIHPTQTAPVTTINSPGTLSFTSSGQFNTAMTEGYNDVIQLSLGRIPTPPAGMTYYAWLLPDQGDDSTIPLLLGTFHAGPVHMIYTSPGHTNLLASYSRVQVTLQPEVSAPEMPSQDPTTWRWDGSIPNIPTPGEAPSYSLLDHVRHLLASDPTLQANHIPGGLVLWLTQNVSQVQAWAATAQGSWHGIQTSESDIRLMQRILAYLDGIFYYHRDVPVGSPWLVDPVTGKIGLLDSVQNQEPPAYLEHVDLHLRSLAEAPGHTAQQQQLAIIMDSVIARMRTDLQHVRRDAAELVKMTPQQIRQPGNRALLDEIARLTMEVTSGWFDPATGENIGGTVWIASRLQQLAVITLTASKHQKNALPTEV